MTTYTNHEQRILDQQSGMELDREARRIFLTPEQAAEMLAPGERVHNFLNPGVGMLIGCDYDRANAIEELKAAKTIEIGGEQCKAMKHAIVCWREDGPSFFEADMAKIDAYEAAHATRKAAQS